MNGDRLEFSQVRIQEILKTEFLVSEAVLNQRDVRQALAALEAYCSMEEFLEKTGWGRDNPEYSSEEYLTENRICRWVDGMLLYFARLVWEDMESGNEGEIHI